MIATALAAIALAAWLYLLIGRAGFWRSMISTIETAAITARCIWSVTSGNSINAQHAPMHQMAVVRP